MKTFILLTFGFLAVAFYQMSGGSDFQPASARMAAVQPAATKVEARGIEIIRQTSQQDVVTRTSLNLTSVNDPAPAVRQDSDAQSQERVEETPVEEADTGAGPTDAGISLPGTTSVVIPSLIAPRREGTIITSANGARDLREVSAARVNVRGGPGTEYGVVARLQLGDAVEVIEDPGTGWILMRPLDGSPEGWMADFLLTDG